MDKKPYLSVIIPAYNEGDQLPIILINIDKYLRETQFDYEILIINDASNDNTIDIVHKFLPIVKGLRLINNTTHSGKGSVMRQSIIESNGNLRLFMNAWNAISAEHFSKMIPFLDGVDGEKYDIVIGSRNINGSKITHPYSLFYHACEYVTNVMARMFISFHIKDYQCEFKCFSEEAAKRIFSILTINDSATDIEALAVGSKIGYKIKEIPIMVTNNMRHNIRISSYAYLWRDILKIKMRLWTNHYKLSK